MYLGVHTPLDVGVSIVVSLGLAFGLYPVIRKGMESKKTMRVLFAAMLILAVAFVAFVEGFSLPVDVDPDNLHSGVKKAYTMLGCIAALWLTYEIDTKYIKFDTKAVWWAQIIKLGVGFGILLGIKSGIKAPLHAIMNANIADGLRYFLMTAFAGCVWPLTFKFFGKLGKKK